MGYPKAYKPQYGYMYQILIKSPDSRTYEHYDYAKNRAEKDHVLTKHEQAYGQGCTFKVVPIPQKYWQINKRLRRIAGSRR
jgi:hypothetical protein